MAEIDELLANVLVFIPYGILKFCLFLNLQRRLPYFYHRNLLIRGDVKRPFLHLFGTIWERLPPWMLLTIAGLDGFLMVEAFRMIFVMCVILAVPLLLILLPWYVHYGNIVTIEKWTYFNFTSVAAYDRRFWLPLVMAYLVACIVLYTIYAFYRKTILLRRVFLSQPSTVMSLQTLLNAAEGAGSIEGGRKIYDQAARTVMLPSLPAHWSRSHLRKILEEAGVNGFTAVSVICTDNLVRKAVGVRKAAVHRLEQAVVAFTDSLVKSNANIESERLSVEDRSTLLLKLITDRGFFEEYRPKHKIKIEAQASLEGRRSKAIEKELDSLSVYYEELLETDLALQDALKAFEAEQEMEETNGQEQGKEDVHDDAEPIQEYPEEVSLISLKQLAQVQNNAAPAAKAFTESSPAALIHFESIEDAQKAKQMLRSAEMAPLQPSIYWNEGTKASQRPSAMLRRRLCSEFFYIVVLLLCVPVSAFVMHLADLEELGKFIPAVEQFRESNEILTILLQGILAPYLVQKMMNKASALVQWAIDLAGGLSEEERIARFIPRMTFFVVFHSVIVSMIFGSLHQLFELTMLDGVRGWISHLRAIVPGKSHVFIDLLLQSTCVELTNMLLGISDLIQIHVQRAKNATPRERLAALKSVGLSPATISISRLFFPFLITTSFMLVSPLFIVPAILYFWAAYYVHRFQFIHYGRTAVETGGRLWPALSRQLIYALFVGQVFLASQFSAFESGLPALALLIVLMGLTLAAIPFFENTFRPQYEHLALLHKAHKEMEWWQKSLATKQETILFGRHITEALPVNLKPNADPKQDTPATPNSTVFDLPGDSEEPPFFEYVPLPLSRASGLAAREDPLKLARLLDGQFLEKPYSHPCLLEHETALIVPRKLPSLLKNIQQ